MHGSKTEPAAEIKWKIKYSTKWDGYWLHVAIILGRLTLSFGKPKRGGESQNKHVYYSSLVAISQLILEKFQTMFLVQVSAPKLAVIFSICEISVYGSRSILCQWLWRADYCIIIWAKEWSNWHPCLFSIHNSSVPHTLIPSITQCLQLITLKYITQRILLISHA